MRDRQIILWKAGAIAFAVLGSLYAFAGSSGSGPALASQTGSGFCELTDAGAVLKRLKGRQAEKGIRLTVSKQRVESGTVVKARLLNFSKDVVRAGAEFKVQRYGQAGWTTDPSSPDGPWPRAVQKLSPGNAGRCYRFSVSATQTAGRYRFLTRIEVGSASRQRVAEFSVLGVKR